MVHLSDPYTDQNMSEQRHLQLQPCLMRRISSQLCSFRSTRNRLMMPHHRPHSVILMIMFCSVKNSSISHVVEGQAAIGVLQVSGSGEPDVMSAGMLARCSMETCTLFSNLHRPQKMGLLGLTGQNHVLIPSPSHRVAKTPPPFCAKGAPYLRLVYFS